MTASRASRRSANNGACRNAAAAAARVSAKRPEMEQRSEVLSALVESDSLMGFLCEHTLAAKCYISQQFREKTVAPSAVKSETDRPISLHLDNPTDTWPTLREAEARDEGFHLCDSAHEETTPDGVDDDEAWTMIEVSSGHLEASPPQEEAGKELERTEGEESPGSPTFADLVRRQGGPSSVQPPEEGTRLSSKSTTMPTRERQPSKKAAELDDQDDGADYLDDLGSHDMRGWTKHQKGSRSVRAKHVIAESVAKRAEQRRQATEQ
jgi:hypothetical protein